MRSLTRSLNPLVPVLLEGVHIFHGGYRRPLTKYLPEKLREVISDCWAQDMHMRPSMASVVSRLQKIESLNIFEKKSSKSGTANGSAAGKTAVNGPVGAAKKGCCTVM